MASELFIISAVTLLWLTLWSRYDWRVQTLASIKHQRLNIQKQAWIPFRCNIYFSKSELPEEFNWMAVKWRIDRQSNERELKFTSEAKQATQCSVENISAKTLCMKKCWKTMIALQDTVDTTVHFNIETHTIVIKGTK